MKNICFVLLLTLTLGSCDRADFLNRYPLDEITEQSYWKTAKDLELYVNQYYTRFPGHQVNTQSAGIFVIDNNSDNMIPVIFDQTLGGNRTIPASGGGWAWEDIRSVNVFLANYHQVKSSPEEYDSFVGEAMFFKAYFYFNLLQAFGDIPWYSGPLQTDSEGLYAPRTPRNVVADSILALLDNAVGRLHPAGAAIPFRVNKEVALLFKSRVALFEGTWEKYHDHTSFGVNDANPSKYFQQAVDAAETLMRMGSFGIYSTGKPSLDYVSLFNKNDYSGVSEILLWKKFDMSLGMGHSAYLGTYSGHGTGLSKSLVDSYLAIDGRPISLSTVYQGDADYIVASQNRDPRLAQSIFLPGDPVTVRDGAIVNAFEKPGLNESSVYVNTTGYPIEKGHRPVKYSDADFRDSDNASILFRYAEALLNYIEAKAELGTATQDDVNKTINLLRDRVEMPHMDLALIRTWHDPAWEFPDLSPAINEIRRERRVELAAEGFRLDDLRRWRAHHLISGMRPLGAKFIQQHYPDMVIGTDIYLNSEGYIDPYQKSLPNGWEFNPERDYLAPIPTNELTLNEHLIQNPGW